MATNLLALRLTLPDSNSPYAATAGALTARNLSAFFSALASGTLGASTLKMGVNGVAATGSLTVSSASGTVGCSINGVSCTVTAGGSDLATAVLIAGKINAGGNTPNALVSKHVTAIAVDDSGTIKVNITSTLPGFAGNAVTLSASGTGITASGARLTGGTETQETFSFA